MRKFVWLFLLILVLLASSKFELQCLLVAMHLVKFNSKVWYKRLVLAS